LSIGNGLSPASGLVSALGFGSDFVSAIAVGVEGATTDAAGLAGLFLFGAAAGSGSEPPAGDDAVVFVEA
jgi:hypothetical protein